MFNCICDVHRGFPASLKETVRKVLLGEFGALLIDLDQQAMSAMDTQLQREDQTAIKNRAVGAVIAQTYAVYLATLGLVAPQTRQGFPSNSY